MSEKGGPGTSRVNPPLKCHRLGGKFYLAKRIVALMPPHKHYVEPYFGGGAVLLAKDPQKISEVANDINPGLMNFWAVLQSEVLFAEFARLASATPFSEDAWGQAMTALSEHGSSMDQVSWAWCYFIACRQSMAGRMNAFAPLSKTRTRRGMNEQASAWMAAIDGLTEVHERIWRVVILNRPALKAISTQDGKDTLFYLDPPYLKETRQAPDVYEHEMTDAQHLELLQAIKICKGKVMISGYNHPLYERHLGDWTKIEFDMPNNAASGNEKRTMTECLWMNFTPPRTV